MKRRSFLRAGLQDGTGALADRLAKDVAGVRAVHHVPNQGLGGVYRTGFKEARQDFLTFFPADGQFAPEILARFVPLMADHDLVLGYLPEGRKGLALVAAPRPARRLPP